MTADLKAAAQKALDAYDKYESHRDALQFAAAIESLRKAVELQAPAEGDELPPLAVRMAAALREIAKPLAKGSKSILERAADMLEAQPTGTEPAPAPCECPDRGYCDGSCSPGNQPSDGLPNIVTSAPETIYLVIDPDLRPEADFREIMRSFEDSVQWCAEDSYDNGIKYVRADTLPDVQPKGTAPAGWKFERAGNVIKAIAPDGVYWCVVRDDEAREDKIGSFFWTLCDALATQAPAPAPATGDTNGRRDELRSAVHGRVAVGSHTPGALADLLWASHDLMSLNAELVLSMDQLVQLTQAVLTAVPCAAVGAEPVRYPHPDEDDPVTLWKEIRRLRAAMSQAKCDCTAYCGQYVLHGSCRAHPAPVTISHVPVQGKEQP